MGKYRFYMVSFQILLGPAEAPGRINRNRLAPILCEPGIPIYLIRAMLLIRQSIQVCAKHINNACPLDLKNVSAFRRSPLLVQFSIFYPDRDMVNYIARPTNESTRLGDTPIRNTAIESKWSEYVRKVRTRLIIDATRDSKV